MKNKILVLVLSILVAIVVLCVGIFGIGQVRKKNNENKSNSDETVKNLVWGESGDTDKNNESSEETTTTESTTEPTTEEETTTTQISVDDPSKYSNSGIDPTKPMVALTFDDGPNRDNTTRILDALKQYNAHATFFVVGYNIDGNEDVIKRAVDEGSEVGNHTNSHAKLTSLDATGILTEINAVKDRVKEITGEERVVIRPPYGAVDDNVMAAVVDPVILWSIDTLDWKTKNVQCTIENIQNSVFDGSIILMHDIYAESAEAAVQIIDWLNSQGYQMVTVSELGYYRRGGLQTGIRYGSLKPN